jgi:hypothetical protein
VLHEPSPPDCAAGQRWNRGIRPHGGAGRRDGRVDRSATGLGKPKIGGQQVVGGVEGAQSCSNPGLLEQIDHNAPVRACKNAEGARATRLPSSGEPANSSKPSRPQHALGMTVMPDALERGSCHGPVAATMRSRPGPSCRSGPPTLGRIVEPSRILWSTNRSATDRAECKHRCGQRFRLAH